MTSRKLAAFACVVAAGGLVLSGCGGDKPSGLASFTPGGSSSSSAPSRWTPEQQQVIDVTSKYHGLVSKFSKGAKLDMVSLRSVATESFAVEVGKNIDTGLSIGFIQHGDDVHEVRAVKITGAKSTLTECWIGRSYGVNKTATPPVTAKPSPTTIVVLKLTRSAGTWRVSGITDGATCAAKG